MELLVDWSKPIQLEDGSPCILNAPPIKGDIIVSLKLPNHKSPLGICNYFYWLNTGEPISPGSNTGVKLPNVVNVMNKSVFNEEKSRGTFRAIFQAFDISWKN